MPADISQFPFPATVSPLPNTSAAWSGVPGSSDTVLFWNQDLNNTVTLSYRPSSAIGDLNTIPLPPNGQIPLPMSRTIYAFAPAGTANLVVIPGGGTPFLGLTQGKGNLVIPSIRSPNFLHNVSGWSINKDGSAEFNNLTVRGTFFGTLYIINSNGMFFYSPTEANGNLVISIVPGNTNVTGPFGETVGPGIQVIDNTFGVIAKLIAGSLQFTAGISLVMQLNANGLTVGASGNPQVKALVGVNLAVHLQNPNSLANPTDVSSVSNLQQVFQLPTNATSEVAPPTIGQCIITYTNNDTALATIVLSGIQTTQATQTGYFTMWVAPSKTVTKAGGIFSGTYTISGSTLTLTPTIIQRSGIGDPAASSNPLMLMQFGIKMAVQTAATLVPNEENWRQVGTGGNPGFGTGWANFGGVNAPLSFKLLASPDNSVQINGVIKPSAGFITTVFTLPNTPFSFIPLHSQFIQAHDLTAHAAVACIVNSTGAVNLDLNSIVAGDEIGINGIYSLNI